MPVKYSIHGHAMPPRVRPVGKLGIVDWREDCSSCHNCVKRSCVYSLYRDEADRLQNENGYLDYIYQCKGCLSCIQNCTKNILTRVINPEFERLGDDYFTPDIILSTWYQSESGSIPVSGAGYGGPFSGPGFDSMWTDMSEIVRPTRDGIHGREYINTSVDIGRKLSALSFNEGQLAVSPPPLIESPIPMMFDTLPAHFRRGNVIPAIVGAADKLGIYVVVEPEEIERHDFRSSSSVVPLLDPASAEQDFVKLAANAPMVVIQDGPGALELRSQLKQRNELQIIAIRVNASPQSVKRVSELADGGLEAIQVHFSFNGREHATEPRHMRDVIREIHGALIKKGNRDELTLISSGGIAMAEHVTKAVICGVDMVALDLPVMLALECRLCRDCSRGEECPVQLETVDLEFGVGRIVNLMAAWHSQLIEMLGAMGIREVRRLRGETGRCMFFEDLERNTFGRLFGKRKGQKGGTS